MTALIWTRSPMAGEMVALALSRAEIPVTMVPSKQAIVVGLRAVSGPAALILGPSFTAEEARDIGAALVGEAPRLRVVLLEDLVSPLPCRVVVPEADTRILSMPVRVRPLLEAVRGAST